MEPFSLSCNLKQVCVYHISANNTSNGLCSFESFFLWQRGGVDLSAKLRQQSSHDRVFKPHQDLVVVSRENTFCANILYLVAILVIEMQSAFETRNRKAV